MTDENTYTDANGVRYVAAQELTKRSCEGCAHDLPKVGAKVAPSCQAAPQCVGSLRSDKRSIIWIKA